MFFQLASYHHSSNDFSIGIGDTYSDVLVTLEVSGAHAGSTFPTTLPDTFHMDLQNADVDESFVIEMGPSLYINREQWVEPFRTRSVGYT